MMVRTPYSHAFVARSAGAGIMLPGALHGILTLRPCRARGAYPIIHFIALGIMWPASANAGLRPASKFLGLGVPTRNIKKETRTFSGSFKTLRGWDATFPPLVSDTSDTNVPQCPEVSWFPDSRLGEASPGFPMAGLVRCDCPAPVWQSLGMGIIIPAGDSGGPTL